MIAGIVIVKLMVLCRGAPERAIMSHHNNLHRRIRMLLHSPPPKLIEIFIELFMVFVSVREWVPAVYELSLAVVLNFILDTPSKPNNHEVVPEFVNASVDISLHVRR